MTKQQQELLDSMRRIAEQRNDAFRLLEEIASDFLVVPLPSADDRKAMYERIMRLIRAGQ